MIGHKKYSKLILGLLYASLTSTYVQSMACSSGAGIGEHCANQNDCADTYQCLKELCSPPCNSSRDCGDGYLCTEQGQCEAVLATIGDPCFSERDCSVGQSCVLHTDDTLNTEFLSATCQEQRVGGNVASLCTADDQCQNRLCVLGRCSQLCNTSSGCPDQTACSTIPIELDNKVHKFKSCLPSQGVIQHQITMESPSETLKLLVPSSIKSLAILSTIENPNYLVGVTKVVSPDNIVLYNGDTTQAQVNQNIIRYVRSKKISTMLIPGGDHAQLALQTGFYQVSIEASIPPFGTAPTIPKVSVFYTMGTDSILDLHFYFLDLEEHPCSGFFGSLSLNANSAKADNSPFQNEYLVALRNIFKTAEITIGNIQYQNIERADLDGIEGNDLDALFRLAENQSGIAIFFVRSLSPLGVQVKVGGIPGPPRTPGTRASGIAVSMDNLCFQSWTEQAQISAHGIAAQMGLWFNRDQDNNLDSISDSDSGADNLMFFSNQGGTNLSPGQKNVLKQYPGIR